MNNSYKGDMELGAICAGKISMKTLETSSRGRKNIKETSHIRAWDNVSKHHEATSIIFFFPVLQELEHVAQQFSYTICNMTNKCNLSPQ